MESVRRLEDTKVETMPPEYLAIIKEIMAQNRIILDGIAHPVMFFKSQEAKPSTG